NHTPLTQFYTLSLHDALPILRYLDLLFRPRSSHTILSGSDIAYTGEGMLLEVKVAGWLYLQGVSLPMSTANMFTCRRMAWQTSRDRKSTRLNSSHVKISYAVF